MNRVYVSTANFRSPYRNVQFAGLGAAPATQKLAPSGWPYGRSYHDTSHFQAPYKTGYFQDNSLFGVPENVKQGILVAVALGVGAVALGLIWSMQKS